MCRTVVVVLVGLFASTTDLARETYAADAAETLIRKGVDKRRGGNDRAALPLFQEAYDISRTPRAAAQLGLCEQALEMWSQAEFHLSEALVVQTDPWVASNRQVLENSLSDTRSHMASIEIQNAPSSALVVIAGLPRGKASEGPFFVITGDAEISVVAPDSRFETTASDLKAGETRKIKYREADAHQPAATGLRVRTPTSSQAPVARSEASSASGTVLSSAKWVSLGLGVFGLGTGIYGLQSRNQAANDFNSETNEKGERSCFLLNGKVVGSSGGVPDSRCQDLHSRVGSMTTASVVGFTAGAALTSLGFILWSKERNGTKEPDSLACLPRLDVAGVTCARTF